MKNTISQAALPVLLVLLLLTGTQTGVLGLPYQSENHRLGVCDVQVVLDQIPQGKQITDEFNTLRTGMEKSLRDIEAELQQLEAEAQQLQPGSNGRRDIEKRFALKNAELIWKKEDLEKEFATRFSARREALVNLVRTTIEEVATERELDVVVNNVSRAETFKVYVSVWARPELDITMDVINRIAKK
ncbi:MAG: hypothetical protein GWP41_11440 [Planctomycetia bacterium]|jgi:Skp family chaperone for outer membrane proteins|nr:hypothetical protein [Planctomycetia bacterium]NCG11846.1 hypothetical protein [Planctomycetia bacterium]NCG57189.1 hypothetical protein [Pseudomonadota bacterium]